MSWVAQSPAVYVGESVGNGQCVAYVEVAAGTASTNQWTRGQPAKGSGVPWGIAIATFDPDGTYGNHTDGRSHAAIFHQELAEGLLVWDQSFTHPSVPRLVRFQDGRGLACDDGDRFCVIEHV